eukprot:351841-Chlamydomonas_euryale.AAC.19
MRRWQLSGCLRAIQAHQPPASVSQCDLSASAVRITASKGSKHIGHQHHCLRAMYAHRLPASPSQSGLICS